MEDISLFRVEESEAEQELRSMLGLATPEDPEPMVSVELPPRALSKEPENPAHTVETTSLVHNPAPPIHNSSNPPTQLSNDMQVDRMKIPPITAQSRDQTPVKDDPPLPNQSPSTIKFSERPPPASEPLQPPPWNPFGFIGEEGEEEEEIPSINMDSDSD